MSLLLPIRLSTAVTVMTVMVSSAAALAVLRLRQPDIAKPFQAVLCNKSFNKVVLVWTFHLMNMNIPQPTNSILTALLILMMQLQQHHQKRQFLNLHRSRFHLFITTYAVIVINLQAVSFANCDVIVIADSPKLGSDSDDSDGPISRGARRAAIASARYRQTLPAPEFDFPAWRIPTTATAASHAVIVGADSPKPGSDSDNSNGPISLGARRAAIVSARAGTQRLRRRIVIHDSDSSALSPVQVSALALIDPQQHGEYGVPPNLWMAEPHRFDNQFLDLTAKHASDMDEEGTRFVAREN